MPWSSTGKALIHLSSPFYSPRIKVCSRADIRHIPAYIEATDTNVDVVPIEPLTLDQWIEPPYSGKYDGAPTIHAEASYKRS